MAVSSKMSFFSLLVLLSVVSASGLENRQNAGITSLTNPAASISLPDPAASLSLPTIISVPSGANGAPVPAPGATGVDEAATDTIISIPTPTVTVISAGSDSGVAASASSRLMISVPSAANGSPIAAPGATGIDDSSNQGASASTSPSTAAAAAATANMKEIVVGGGAAALAVLAAAL